MSSKTKKYDKIKKYVEECKSERIILKRNSLGNRYFLCIICEGSGFDRNHTKFHKISCWLGNIIKIIEE